MLSNKEALCLPVNEKFSHDFFELMLILMILNFNVIAIR